MKGIPTKTEIRVRTDTEPEPPEHLRYQWTQVEAERGNMKLSICEGDWQHSKLFVSGITMDCDVITPKDLDDLIAVLVDAREKARELGILTPRRIPKAAKRVYGNKRQKASP